MTIQQFQQNDITLIKISNIFCEALISLRGAQILKFHSKKNHKDLLWLSDLAKFETGKAIRGGIPLCFPWFGGHPSDSTLPAHGFARTSLWQLKDIAEDAVGHHVLLELTDSKATRQLWNYAFKLQTLIHCGEELKLEFKLHNLDEQAFEFSFAWHSYFPVITQQARILGLHHTDYIDQLDGNQVKTQIEKDIQFIAETDRIYPKTSGQFVIKHNMDQQIHIQSSAISAVIWNPWIEKSARLADVDDGAWQDFICVETGQIASEKVSLAPQQSVHFELMIQ